MKIKAAVTPKTGLPFEITDVELPEIGSKEVIIKVVASGICHTDVSGRDTDMVNPPSVLGMKALELLKRWGLK